MARTVPGSGAVIEPIFDKIFGVRAVRVVDGGDSYSQADLSLIHISEPTRPY